MHTYDELTKLSQIKPPCCCCCCGYDFLEVSVAPPIQQGVHTYRGHGRQVAAGIDQEDCLIGLLGVMEAVHDDEEDVDGGPGQEEQHADAGEHDVGAPLSGRLPLVSGAGGDF